MNYRETLKVNNSGHLEIGGVDCTKLAERYKTPLYALDEKHIRDMCKVYKQTLRQYYGQNSKVLYASKALCCKAIYKIMLEEGLGADVVSLGELYTALKGGMDGGDIYFHGNNKSEEEIIYALNNNVHAIVLNGSEEVEFIDGICKREGKTAGVLLRINPGVEAHTHHYIQTAKTDSKFGVSVSGGEALDTVGTILDCENLNLLGFHCHIGSQIFEIKPFILAVETVFEFIKQVKETYNIQTQELNLGGGYGIWYYQGDNKTSLDDYSLFVQKIAQAVTDNAERLCLNKPCLVLEPGRAIMGESGITLYTVGNIKNINGVKKYVSIDGGMFDNPRYMLYQAKYSACLADRANEQPTEKVSLAGKCCESGDLIAEDITLPPAKRGNIVAVFSTGAYNYSMASNYNRNPVPPVVLCSEGKSCYIVKPQTLDDIIRNDT